MCIACGLPTTHTNTLQTLGYVVIASFSITTFLAAWWIVRMAAVRRLMSHWRARILRTWQTPPK